MISTRHRFAFTSDNPTTTIVAPEVSTVLTNSAEELAGWVFPLLSVELDGRRFPWVYTQMYGRNADGSPLVLRFVEDGALFRIADRSLDDVRAFHAACGLDQTQPPRRWLRRYLDWVDIEVERVDLQPAENERKWVWIERIQAELRGHPSDARKLFRGQSNIYRGPDPIWLQDDQTPVDGGGARMEFLGQVDASRLTDDAADSNHYLFWSSNDRTLAQVTQLS